MFSSFPDRWPGGGLLLLRGVVGSAAAAQGGTLLANAGQANALVWVLTLLAIVSGTSLLIGFLTPMAGAIAGVCLAVIALSGFAGPMAAPFLDRMGALCLAGVASALVLLGPGAFSVDAFLFGRREIVFPPDSHQPRP